MGEGNEQYLQELEDLYRKMAEEASLPTINTTDTKQATAELLGLLGLKWEPPFSLKNLGDDDASNSVIDEDATRENAPLANDQPSTTQDEQKKSI